MFYLDQGAHSYTSKWVSQLLTEYINRKSLSDFPRRNWPCPLLEGMDLCSFMQKKPGTMTEFLNRPLISCFPLISDQPQLDPNNQADRICSPAKLLGWTLQPLCLDWLTKDSRRTESSDQARSSPISLSVPLPASAKKRNVKENTNLWPARWPSRRNPTLFPHREVPQEKEPGLLMSH